MRKNIESMLGFSIMAVDGELGKVRDIYFDDRNCALRYLIVQTGSWLLGRKVLIAFASVKNINCENHTFSVDLTCDQVRHSPDIDTEKPVHQQHEQELNEHYMLPAYWMNIPEGAWGVSAYPFLGTTTPPPDEFKIKQKTEKKIKAESKPDEEELHLRSTRQISGYLVHATDGEIGHVKDFIIDLDKRIITDLLIDTRNLIPGRKVLLPTENIERIEWADSEVYVNVTCEFIISSPEFDVKQDL